jgi:hypothetical protein
MHLETIGYAATAAAVAGTVAAALAGDSLVVKNAAPGTKVFILAMTSDHQTVGADQLVLPSGHDTTRGYRVRVTASEVANLMPFGFKQEVFPQETMGLTVFGTAVAGDVETGMLWLWYENLPGISGRLITAADARQRVSKLVTVDFGITTVAGPGWTGAEALNTESDLLLPNRDYAVLGAVMSVECAALGIRSPDFGNVRVGVPGNELDPDMTSNWFLRLSESSGLATVPVLSAGNRAAVLLDAAQDENAAAVTASLVLGLLEGAS